MEIVHTRGNGRGRLRMICYLQWWYTVFVYDCHCFQSSFNTSNFIALRPFGKAWMGQDLDHPNICKLLETYEQGRSLPWLDALIAKKVHVDSCWSHGQHVSLKKRSFSWISMSQWAFSRFFVLKEMLQKSSPSDGFGNSASLLAVSKTWQPGLEASCSLSWSAGLKG